MLSNEGDLEDLISKALIALSKGHFDIAKIKILRLPSRLRGGLRLLSLELPGTSP